MNLRPCTQSSLQAAANFLLECDDLQAREAAWLQLQRQHELEHQEEERARGRTKREILSK